jgi:hypothetical protein
MKDFRSRKLNCFLGEGKVKIFKSRKYEGFLSRKYEGF